MTAAADLGDLQNGTFHLPEIKPWKSPSEEADLSLIKQDLKLIKSTMTNYVGLVRSADRLDRARSIVRSLKEQVDRFYADCRLDDSLLNLRNAVLAAHLVIHAATLNTKSRGCHYRADADPEDSAGPTEVA